MASMTLKALRALAKALGLKGYSKLRKKELEQLIERAQRARTTPLHQKEEPGAAAERPAAPVRGLGTQQRVESAKYALDPHGAAVALQESANDFVEDIEQLPQSAEPQLALLPQKPGILHAYWRLDPWAQRPELRLRLLRARGGGIEPVEEIVLPAAHGHWYFHVPVEDEPAGAYYAQLGYYTPHGEFVCAFVRAIARIPSLYACSRTDRRWWISEERFRELYRRAGGFAHGVRLGWIGGAPSSPPFPYLLPSSPVGCAP